MDHAEAESHHELSNILSPPSLSLPPPVPLRYSSETLIPTPKSIAPPISERRISFNNTLAPDASYSTPSGNKSYIDPVQTPNDQPTVAIERKVTPLPPSPDVLEVNESATTKKNPVEHKYRGNVHDRLPIGFNPLVGLLPGQKPKKKVPKRDESEPDLTSNIEDDSQSELLQHHKDPFQLDMLENSTVEACFPFHGDENLLQVHFYIGDSIVLLKKDKMWSWGRVIRTGQEGWFPNNYVQGAFRPLPGIHEMMIKLGQDKKGTSTVANSMLTSDNVRGGSTGFGSEITIQKEGVTQDVDTPSISSQSTENLYEKGTSKDTVDSKDASVPSIPRNWVKIGQASNDTKTEIIGPVLPPFQPESMVLKVPPPKLGQIDPESFAVIGAPEGVEGGVPGEKEGMMGATLPGKIASGNRAIDGVGQENGAVKVGCKCVVM